MSIFDIAFPVVKEEPKDLIVEPEVKTGQVPEQEQNLCPYKVPTIEDIIKRINASVYRFDKHQLISDVFECGAITISNCKMLLEKACNGEATFDARAFNIPQAEVCNYFIWRQQDATRNSIQMFAQKLFTQEELQGKNNDTLQEMMYK